MALDVTGLGAVADLAGNLIDRFFPNKSEQEKAQMAAALTIIQGQLDVNKNEASSTSIFVSGARPFILWICGVAFGYASIIEPVSRFIALVGFGYTGIFPAIDTEITMQILFGILGLGAFRSWDKKNGVAS